MDSSGRLELGDFGLTAEEIAKLRARIGQPFLPPIDKASPPLSITEIRDYGKWVHIYRTNYRTKGVYRMGFRVLKAEADALVNLHPFDFDRFEGLCNCSCLHMDLDENGFVKVPQDG